MTATPETLPTYADVEAAARRIDGHVDIARFCELVGSAEAGLNPAA